MRKLTAKQQQILVAINQNERASYKELAQTLGYPQIGSVQSLVNALRVKGYLRLSTGKARDFQLTTQAKALLNEEGERNNEQRV